MSKYQPPLEIVRDEDFVEYFLFPKITDNENNDSENLKNFMENLLAKIQELIEAFNKNYIWHKDEFNLTIRTRHQQILLEDNNETKVELPVHFYGITHYGDNIQDEWFLVFLIKYLTKNIPDLIGRIIDSDGEFLLIEAADFLPKWANPDTCEQRVFLHDGNLQLVQNSPSSTSSILPISAGISKIWQNPNLYRVTGEIQKCIDDRLKDFTESNSHSFHHQIIRVPLGVAAILKERPNLIAPACRAFCDRDQIDNKALRAMRFFPPENRVKTCVKFTRCLYAMITHQSYTPDRRIGWELPAPGTQEYKEDILGVKIACGFEILASQAKENGNEFETDREWKTYLNSLTQKNYFNNNIEGSQEYNRLLDDAKRFYSENLSRFRTRPIVGKEIIQLLRNIDNSDQLKLEENNLRPSDSDSWINISPEELDEMLTQKYGIKKLYKINGEANASEFTSNVQEFLEKTSEFDGVDPVLPRKTKLKKNQSMRKAINEQPISDNPTESKSDQIQFDPDSFSTHVKNFLDFVIPEDNWESNSEMSDYEDDDDLEKNIDEMSANEKCAVENDIKNYMDQMDKELSRTTIGKTFSATAQESSIVDDDFDDIESFKPIDINVNTLKNMMDSYRSQLGGPGPTSNLLSAVGVAIGANSSNNDNEKPVDLTETQV